MPRINCALLLALTACSATAETEGSSDSTSTSASTGQADATSTADASTSDASTSDASSSETSTATGGDETASSGGSTLPPGAVELEESPWRIGNADAGFDVLRYQGFAGAGIPLEIFLGLPGGAAVNALDRTGDAVDVPWYYNAFETESGVVVASPNCLSCHASMIGDQLVIGLGNTSGVRLPTAGELAIVGLQVANAFGEDSPETEAFAPFERGFSAVEGAQPPFTGPNSAFFIEEIGIAHRDPQTMEWLDEARFTTPPSVLASDVPPWWHLEKKHALYYNGMGRGDAARLLMQAGVVATLGVDDLMSVDAGMPDLLAYLLTVEAPTYPGAIDTEDAALGQLVFEANCAVCHGTYGADWAYPNLLIPVDVVGTDPAYARHFVDNPGLADSYNAGWFSSGDPTSALEPFAGYVAPPLDGIWVTAPYFHNGSVPSLAGVLDSTERPAVWARAADGEPAYDVGAPGLAFTPVSAGTPDAYDTAIPGYGAGGHTFGDALTPAERTQILEYLKTL